MNGGPPWIGRDKFDLETEVSAADAPGAKSLSYRQRADTLQPLLEEWCRLKVHRETTEFPVYNLVIAKGSPKLTPSKNGKMTRLSSVKNEISAQAVTLDQFAHSLLWTPICDRFVEDQTGLTGPYDFTLTWRSDPLDGSGAVSSAEDLPPLFDAIREQSGLKVVDSKSRLEVIVIDHIERPSQN